MKAATEVANTIPRTIGTARIIGPSKALIRPPDITSLMVWVSASAGKGTAVEPATATIAMAAPTV